MIGKQNLLLSGLEKILQSLEGQTFLITYVSDVRDALDRYRHNPHHLSILLDDHTDLSSSNVVQEIKYISRNARVLVICGILTQAKVLSLIDSKADGIVSLDCPQSSFVAALMALRKGETYYCHVVAQLLADRILGKERKVSTGSDSESESDITGALHILSRREKEIFYALLQGLPPEEIAEFLNISVKTVSSHKSNIFQKFGLKTDYELFRLGLAIGVYS